MPTDVPESGRSSITYHFIVHPEKRSETMDRRDFLRLTGAASATIMYPTLPPPAFAQGTEASAWKVYEVTTRIEVLKPSGVTRVWVPTPLTQDAPYEKSLGNSYEAEGGTSGYSTDSKYSAGMVWAEWPVGAKP